MPQAGFEFTIPASKPPQIYVLDLAAPGSGRSGGVVLLILSFGISTVPDEFLFQAAWLLGKLSPCSFWSISSRLDRPRMVEKRKISALSGMDPKLLDR
jgi:hypothetical protein